MVDSLELHDMCSTGVSLIYLPFCFDQSFIFYESFLVVILGKLLGKQCLIYCLNKGRLIKKTPEI